MSVIVDFSMYPLDKGESLSPYVARSIRIIQESGLPYEFRSMGTSIEGEWEEVMAVVNRCFELDVHAAVNGEADQVGDQADAVVQRGQIRHTTSL